MSVGVKETLEVLVAFEAASEALVKACEDRSFGLLDLRHVVAPARAAAAAVKDVAKVKEELKDLDDTEVEQLVTKLAAVVAKCAEAFAAVSETVDHAD
jgi:hypothetical protein